MPSSATQRQPRGKHFGAGNPYEKRAALLTESGNANYEQKECGKDHHDNKPAAGCCNFHRVIAAFWKTTIADAAIRTVGAGRNKTVGCVCII